MERGGGRKDVAVVLGSWLLEAVQGGEGGKVSRQSRRVRALSLTILLLLLLRSAGRRLQLGQLDGGVLGQGDVQRLGQEAQLVQVGKSEGRLRGFRHLDEGIVLLREQHLDPHDVTEHAFIHSFIGWLVGWCE